jgi:hypothetical protein
LLHGPPLHPECFRGLDPAATRLAAAISVRLDDSVAENGAVLEVDGGEPVRVDFATGSPARPMSGEQRSAKLSRLAGTRLDGIPERSAALEVSELLAISGFG